MRSTFWSWLGAVVAICTVGIAAMLTEGPNKSEFVHSVYFWLEDDVTIEQKNQFFALLQGLREIKSVQRIDLGIPAGTPRDIVDNSYDVALIVYFKDKTGHDAYQEDKIHTDAIALFEGWIADIKIYDAICEY